MSFTYTDIPYSEIYRVNTKHSAKGHADERYRFIKDKWLKSDMCQTIQQ